MSLDYFKEWRTADRAASAAEKAVLEKSLAAIEGVGEFPSDAEIRQSHALRASANDLYQAAMDEMAAAVRGLKR